MTSSTRRKPQQARAQQTVAKILDAALHAVEAQGFARVTTREIADRAEIGVGTLYEYFPHKEAIFSALIDLQRQELNQALAEVAQQTQQLEPMLAVERLLARYIALLLRRPRCAAEFVRRRATFESREKRRLHHRQTQHWLAALLANRLKLTIDPEIAAFVIVKLVDGVTLAAIEERLTWSEDGGLQVELIRAVNAYLDAICLKD